MGRQIEVDDLADSTVIITEGTGGRVRDWVRRHENFSSPLARISRFAVWAWPDVEAWAQATRRL